jgi:hypothetical protein
LTLYLISGLGADKRMFQKLQLPPGLPIVYIDWVEPLPKEPLEDYCRRLASCINAEREFILIGLSLGGIVSIEIAKFLHPKKIIIVSSIATKYEMPWTFKLAKFLNVYKLVPLTFLKTPSTILSWIFGAKTSQEKALLKQIIMDTPLPFLGWAIEHILHWTNTQRPKNLVHIHGTADKLLLCRATHADYKIKGGEHLMVYSKAEEVSAIINQVIESNFMKAT